MSNCFADVDASKSYAAALDALVSGNDQKAMACLDMAINAGLQGQELSDAHLELYYLSHLQSDRQTIASYEAKCRNLSGFSPLNSGFLTLELRIVKDRKSEQAGDDDRELTAFIERFRVQTGQPFPRSATLEKMGGCDLSRFITKMGVRRAGTVERYLYVNLNKEGKAIFNQFSKRNPIKPLVVIVNGKIARCDWAGDETTSGEMGVATSIMRPEMIRAYVLLKMALRNK
jgi:hypothetical protein